MMDLYQNVGQAKIFNLARTANRSILGKIEEVTGDNVRVTFPLDMPNGIRGFRADFMRSQFGEEPKIGQNIQIYNDTISFVRGFQSNKRGNK